MNPLPCPFRCLTLVFVAGVASLATGMATTPAPLAAQDGPPRAPSERPTLADSLATWYGLGMGAHHLCAGLWVVGRDHARTPEAVVAEDLAPFPALRWQEDFRYDVDPAGRRVTLSAPGVDARMAKYSGDQGCAILPAGADDVFFEPVPVPHLLPDPGEQEWPTGDRNAHARFNDVDHAAIEALLDWAFDDTGRSNPQNTRGVVIAYRGHIIGERYVEGWGPNTPQLSWSAGKSIVSALIGVLVQQGELAPEQPAPVEAWQGERDPRRHITIADLLRMSSGLDFDNFGLNPGTSYTAANEHFRIYFDALDVAAHSIHQPLRYPPGTVWRYRNSDPLTLAHIVRQVAQARGENPLTFPQRHLFDRIGMRSVVLETDAWGNFIPTGYDYVGTRDWARFGLLHLWDGVWEGERILPEGWIDFVTTPAPGDPSRGYGGQFWLNRGAPMRMPSLPADAYMAAGFMGQEVVIIPSRDLVVARQGPSSGGFGSYFDELVARVLAALGDR